MPVPFSYQRTNGKSLTRLSLKITPGGKVIVSAPRFMPQFLIDQFLISKADWVAAQLAKIKATATAPDSHDEYSHLPKTIAVFGKKLPLQITQEPDKSPKVTIAKTVVLVNTWQKSLESKAAQTKLLAQVEQQLYRLAEKYLLTRTQELGKIMNTTYGRVTLRSQQTRWGSCSSQGNLNFNWNLIHFAPDIIDSVIIHELAHRTHLNHSRAFWAHVAKYDPAHLQHRGWLKRHGQIALE